MTDMKLVKGSRVLQDKPLPPNAAAVVSCIMPLQLFEEH